MPAEPAPAPMPRRRFLAQVGRGAVAAGVAAAVLRAPAPLLAAPRAGALGKFNTHPGKVWTVRSEQCFEGERRVLGEIRRMVAAGLQAVTGKEDPAAAWRALVSTDDTVGLNVNPISTDVIPTALEVTQAVAEGLLAAGLPRQNVVIFDLTQRQLEQAGYAKLAAALGIRCEGIEGNAGPLGGYDRDVVYQPSAAAATSDRPAYFGRIVTKGLTKIVNMPVLKHHAIAGITSCLKGLSFGIVSDRPRYHPSKCHPMIAETIAHPHIKDKVVLNIVDATEALYDSGPTPRSRRFVWAERALLFGTDPVACDQVGLEIIEQKRAAEGRSSIAARAVHVAGCEAAGLGTASKVEHRTLTLGDDEGREF